MTYIPTAPDLEGEVTDTVRARRKEIAALEAKGRSFYGSTDRDDAGNFTTVGESRVTVHALVKSSQERKPGPTYGWEIRLKVGANATCHGNGCVSPDFEQWHNGHFLIEDDANVTAKAAMPPVQAVREWAQSHAETCRAQPYSGR